jgi:superfamily I DNA/RNA helicase
MEDRGIETRKGQASVSDDHRKPGIRVATMHRVKGLEYDRMIITGVTNKMMPVHLQKSRSSDKAVPRVTELMERAVLYVAITRGRRLVLVTAHGELSEWLTKDGGGV